MTNLHIQSAGIRQALSAGSRAALHIRPLLPLYLGSLVLGLIQTWPLLLATGQGALHNLLLADLANGGPDELVRVLIANGAARTVAALWLVLFLPLIAIYGVLYSFFSGGVLQAWAVVPGQALGYWAVCRRYFWSYMAISWLVIILTFVLVAGATAGIQLLGYRGWSVAVLVILGICGTIGEYARVIAVVRGSRNPAHLIGASLRFCAGHLPGVLGLIVLSLVPRLALIAIYLPVAGLLSGSPVSVLWQQLFLAVALWLKFLRMAWGLHYVQAVDAGRDATVLSRAEAAGTVS